MSNVIASTRDPVSRVPFVWLGYFLTSPILTQLRSGVKWKGAANRLVWKQISSVCLVNVAQRYYDVAKVSQEGCLE